jgi:hypothetical protein
MRFSKRWVWVAVVSVCLLTSGGCGNVYLTGDALTSVQTSTLDAYGFLQRVNADANASPLVRGYAVENVQQWRYFARGALRNPAWGPKLPGEANQ